MAILKNGNDTYEIGNDEGAILFKEDGSINLFVPKTINDDDEVPVHIQAMFAIVFAMDSMPGFKEMVWDHYNNLIGLVDDEGETEWKNLFY